jgi:NAD(P)-dependent dehydrogenase (short-subunit alcohol dehydrogenase family)
VFADRIAVVTGGASGIGAALVDALSDQGTHVVAADIEPVAGVVPLDVCNREAVQALVDDVVARHGRIDYLFNNAGIAMGGRTIEMRGEHWDRTIAVNLGGVVNGVLAAYPQMVRQGYGHIVNTASAAGLAPAVLTAPYSTTKHAVVGLSTVLRSEAAHYGVKVSVLCPGVVDTPILDRDQPADLPPRADQALSPRRFLDIAHLKPMPAAVLAERALRAVARNKGIIVIPPSARALWYLHRISPAVIDRVNRQLARRVLDAVAP